MSKLEDFSKTAASFYEAISIPEKWALVPQYVADFIDGHKGTFMMGPDQDNHAAQLAFNHDDAVQDLYNAHYFEFDPWWEISMRTRPGTAIHAQEVFPVSSMKSTEYHEEMFIKGDVGDTLFSVIESKTGAVSGISIHKSYNKDPYNKTNKQLFQYLIPHLSNAFSLSREFSDQKTYTKLYQENSNQLVFLIEKSFRVIPFSKHLENAHDLKFIRLHQQKLDILDGKLKSQISRSLVNAIDRGIGNIHNFIWSANRQIYQFRIMPIENSMFSRVTGLGINYAALIIDLPHIPVQAGHEIISQRYGLTTREAELLTAFSRLLQLKDAADSIGMTYETSRWHMKSILQKTECQSQNALVRKITHADHNYLSS